MKPTEEQIAAEILWLETHKSRIPRETAFGDDNHAAIDAQIAALRERMTEDEILDGGAAGGKDWDNREMENARDAALWMEGEEDRQPSGPDNWGSLVK